MKIGIVTFQRAENYGAALQCRALYTYLRAKGHDVSVIDYRNPNIEKRYSFFPKLRKNMLRFFESYVFLLVHYGALKGKRRKYRDFFAGAQRTRPLTKEELLAEDMGFDLLIAGSDQVWNPGITKGLDEIYYLQLPGDFRRASYAASLGGIHYPQFSDERFTRYLASFDHLATREKDAAAFIGQKLGRPVLQTLDPTLLLTEEQWSGMVSGVHMQLPEKYVFVYDLATHPDVACIARDLASRYGMPIVYLNHHKQFSAAYGKDVVELIDVGPLELVYLMKHADKVVTTSFHGTAFSCIFRKDAYLFIPRENKGKDTRITTLAEIFGISGRIFYGYDEFTACQRTDPAPLRYEEERFAQVLRQSVDYLDTITRNNT